MSASRSLGIIGVPTSAAAFAPGQEQAPQALREAGLIGLLEIAGAEVHDHGDRESRRWRPDRENRRAQNLSVVSEIVRDTAGRVQRQPRKARCCSSSGAIARWASGTVAGLVGNDETVGLIYFDVHADLNVPASVTEGALDWMGLAHMLGVDGAAEELVHAGDRAPLLEPSQVLLFAWGPDQATAFEREVIARRGIELIPVAEVSADPVGAAMRALRSIEGRCQRLIVHFDVDVIDFTDVPLSENSGPQRGSVLRAGPGRTRGDPSLAAARSSDRHRAQPGPCRARRRRHRAPRRADRRRPRGG